jgi:hypothetical protein
VSLFSVTENKTRFLCQSPVDVKHKHCLSF